jgi:hypothetical protein
MPLLIQDGFTLDGDIPARGPYPAVAFRYRPALAEDVYEYTQARVDSGKKRLEATVAIVAKHIVSWDVEDGDKKPVPITPATLARVPQPYLDAMLDHVTGYAYVGQAADAKN